MDPRTVASTTAAAMAASRILHALEHMERWLWPAQRWVRGAARTRDASEQVLDFLLQDRRGRFFGNLELQGAAQEHFIGTVKARLLADDKFYQKYLSGKRTLEGNARHPQPLAPRTW